MAKFQRRTKEERCDEIMAAGKQVFLKKGYRNTTMEDIIAQTCLSKGGVYQYYKSTKAILFDIMEAGNVFRQERSEEILAMTLSETGDIYEAVTAAIMAKIFDRTPETKLYLMFLAEILYDKDFEQLFLQLEKQAHELIKQTMSSLKEPQPYTLGVNPEIQVDIPLYSRLLNGVLIICNLFRDNTIFDAGKDTIHNIIYTTVKNAF